MDLELRKRPGLGSVNTSPDKPASRIAPSLRDQLAAYERRIIPRTLAAAAGNRSRAAKLLGLSRTALFDRLKKYELATGLADAAAGARRDRRIASHRAFPRRVPGADQTSPPDARP